MSDNRKVGGERDRFAVLETQEQQRVTATSAMSMPPPAEPPKIPTCHYCGQPLDATERRCVFCPARQPQVPAEPAEPLQPKTRCEFYEVVATGEAELLLPKDAATAAHFLGLRNKVPT